MVCAIFSRPLASCDVALFTDSKNIPHCKKIIFNFTLMCLTLKFVKFFSLCFFYNKFKMSSFFPQNPQLEFTAIFLVAGFWLVNFHNITFRPFKMLPTLFPLMSYRPLFSFARGVFVYQPVDFFRMKEQWIHFPFTDFMLKYKILRSHSLKYKIY